MMPEGVLREDERVRWHVRRARGTLRNAEGDEHYVPFPACLASE